MSPTIRIGTLLLALSCALPAPASDALNLLVFTRTEGWVHDSIPDGIRMMEAIAEQEGWTVTDTDDPSHFTPDQLADYDVIVFLSTTGDVLDAPHQAALEGYIQGGGGWLGIHSAANTEEDWAWFGGLLGGGAWFISHPEIQEARVVVEKPDHPATGFPPPDFRYVDEWYNFMGNPRGAVDVLLTLDETSYDPGGNAIGDDHPIAWAHSFDGGRSVYTALGHRSETFADPAFRSHIRGAVVWAAGVDD